MMDLEAFLTVFVRTRPYDNILSATYDHKPQPYLPIALASDTLPEQGDTTAGRKHALLTILYYCLCNSSGSVTVQA